MPSPFPGMDPYIERWIWPDFHARFISTVAEALTPGVRPRYVVRVEERVYLEHQPESAPEFTRPDITILTERAEPRPGGGGVATATAVAPVRILLPLPERVRERYLTVRDRETMDVVTIVEILSPSNKRKGSDGLREYLEKREQVLLSATHLVELDLLRHGERLPAMKPLPPEDYYAFVSRGNERPEADVYAWSIRHPMPVLPIPLAGDDPDVALNLQAVFTSVYDRAGYDYSLDYRSPLDPPLHEVDAAWARELLAAVG